MFTRTILIICGLLALGGGLAVATFSGNPPVETFTGNPVAPAPFSDTEWDVQVHSRDSDTWFALDAINAQHGPDCSAPPATHANTSYEGSVFQCRDHVMTAINAPGYGVIYLTPNRLFNFSAGGSVQFDLSTEHMSTRDWWDLTIQPYDNNMALPLHGVAVGVDLQGPPPNSINVAIDNAQAAPTLTLFRNGVEEYLDFGLASTISEGIVAGTNQSATRQTFKLTVANGRMKFERLASATATALVYFDVAETVNFSSGIIQFGHHSYNPTKDGAGVPATWHWDNISVEPATPFTIIKADRRYTEGGQVNFASPAPSGAYLRFSAVCRVTVDGAPVTPVKPVQDEAKFSSYFLPIPAGTQSASIGFAPDGWYAGPCLAKDFSIWSQSVAPGNTPTNTSIPSPTSTATAISTNTPSATPTATSTPTQIPTPTATATPVPPTATPTPQLYECRHRDQRQTRPVGSTTWQTANDPWSTVTIVSSRAECVGD